jgi:hypothetical protein
MQIAKTIAYMTIAVSLLGGFIVGAAQAAGDKAEHIMVAPDAVKWVDAPPSLPAGAKWAVLEGDPTQAGLWVPKTRRTRNLVGWCPCHHAARRS